MIKKNMLLSASAVACVMALCVSHANAQSPQMPVYPPTVVHLNPVKVASDNAILRVDNEVGIAAMEQYGSYAEFGNNATLDSEKGYLPGLSVKLSHTFNVARVKNIYVSLEDDMVTGQVKYASSGFSESASHVDNKLEGKLGKVFFVGNKMALTPYVFGGYHTWHRNVPNGAAAPENYSNELVGAGLMTQYALTPKIVLSATGEFGEQIGGSMNGATNPLYVQYFGAAPNLKYNLTSRPYYSIGANADYAVTNNVHLYGDVKYSSYMYGQSQSITSGLITTNEPTSTTNDLNLDVGVAYSF